MNSQQMVGKSRAEVIKLEHLEFYLTIVLYLTLGTLIPAFPTHQNTKSETELLILSHFSILTGTIR